MLSQMGYVQLVVMLASIASLHALLFASRSLQKMPPALHDASDTQNV